MRILTKDEFLKKEEFFLSEMSNGKIFVYPTDTIYGLGCDATDESPIKRIREIKMRDAKPFSVIAPSKEWIKENCVISIFTEKWLEKLPGRYTLILKLKNFKCIARKSLVGEIFTIGARIPDNWFAEIVRKFNKPFVTTSANILGKDHMTELNNLDENIKAKIDYIVYEGKLENLPSKIIDLTDGERVIREF